MIPWNADHTGRCPPTVLPGEEIRFWTDPDYQTEALADLTDMDLWRWVEVGYGCAEALRRLGHRIPHGKDDRPCPSRDEPWHAAFTDPTSPSALLAATAEHAAAARRHQGPGYGRTHVDVCVIPMITAALTRPGTTGEDVDLAASILEDTAHVYDAVQISGQGWLSLIPEWRLLFVEVGDALRQAHPDLAARLWDKPIMPIELSRR